MTTPDSPLSAVIIGAVLATPMVATLIRERAINRRAKAFWNARAIGKADGAL